MLRPFRALIFILFTQGVALCSNVSPFQGLLVESFAIQYVIIYNTIKAPHWYGAQVSDLVIADETSYNDVAQCFTAGKIKII